MRDSLDEPERTEAASPRRVAELREQGHWPRSPELVAAGAVCGALVVLKPLGASLASNLADLVHATLTTSDVRHSPAQCVELALGRVAGIAGIVVAIPLVVAAVAIALSIGQGGLRLSWGRLRPSGERFGRGLTQFSPGAFGAAAWCTLKWSLGVGLATWWAWTSAAGLASGTATSPLATTSGAARLLELAIRSALVFLVVSLVDYGAVWWRWHAQSRMTRAELVAEQREQQGSRLTRRHQLKRR